MRLLRVVGSLLSVLLLANAARAAKTCAGLSDNTEILIPAKDRARFEQMVPGEKTLKAVQLQDFKGMTYYRPERLVGNSFLIHAATGDQIVTADLDAFKPAGSLPFIEATERTIPDLVRTLDSTIEMRVHKISLDELAEAEALSLKTRSAVVIRAATPNGYAYLAAFFNGVNVTGQKRPTNALAGLLASVPLRADYETEPGERTHHPRRRTRH